MIHFAEPMNLWLLAIIPAILIAARRLRLIPRMRRWMIVSVRVVLMLLLVLALARTEIRWEAKDMAVFFLLDRSDSIPASAFDAQATLLQNAPKKAAREDSTGVIAFSAKPSMETSPVPRYEYPGKVLSATEGSQTDIASAVRLALAAFPGDTIRRVVLISDGNENSGSALEMARVARGAGVPIDVMPVRYDSRNDLKIDKLVVPQRTSKDAPFDLKVHLSAEQASRGLLRVYRDGEVVAEQEVEVAPGKNPPLVMTQRIADGGFHQYSAVIENRDDPRPQNNRAQAFTYLKAEPKVLLIDGSSEPTRSAAFLATALRAENIIVEAGGPSLLPVSLPDLQKYDTLVLSNMAAGDMSQAQMQMIERAVHDLGLGLIMIGGENSFGAGGYNDTPIEKALPVRMDIKQKKILPNGALAIVLHTCEIPSGNAWAKEISIASLNVLSAQDYFGIAYLGSDTFGGSYTDRWAWEPGLQQVGDKRAMRNTIKGVAPLDMMSFDPTLRLAAKALSEVKAQTKHIVVISDGDPSPPDQDVVNSIRNQGITVSAVAIAPHSGMTVDTLEQMAYWGGGNFYYPKTSSELPRIFTKEATVVRKSLIREERFNPVSNMQSEILTGFVSLPSLDGYVITTTKELATEALATEFEDPLLVHWRYGLGKTVAFTSDAKDKWASSWVQWPNFAKFWAQVVRWSLRETNNANYQVNTEVEGGQGRLTIDAVDENGNFINFLDFSGSIIKPNFESEEVKVSQTAPGRYEATFPAGQVGSYMASLTAKSAPDAEPQFVTGGVSLAYSPEYESSRSADEFLKRIAEASGGQFISDAKNYNPYARNLPPARRPLPLWPWLLLGAILLVPVDVFLRRVYLDWAEFLSWFRTKVMGLLPARTPLEEVGRLESLKAAKERALQEREEEKREREVRDSFRERLAQQTSERGSEPSVFEGQDKPGPGMRSTKHTVTPDNEGAPPAQGGMSSLMEAKKRAQKRKK
ncbi:VWA domain-containing protein [bacterium]|nr:VWA domain-containing protein [bacterium]